MVGASNWALDPSRAERTLAHIGALGGLLADLGYDVYAVSALPDLDARPSFVGWVGGDETAAEHDQLVALDAPGLAVGATVDGIETWGSIEPDDHHDSIEFVRAALHEIRHRTDGTDHPKSAPDGAEISTASSTVRPDTRAYGMGQPDYDDPRNSSAGARSGTKRDGPTHNPKVAGSNPAPVSSCGWASTGSGGLLPAVLPTFYRRVGAR